MKEFPSGFFPASGRRQFYKEFLEFTRRYPEVKIRLDIPRNDLPLLAGEEWSPVVDNLLALCRSGRLTLGGTIRRADLLDHLRKINKGGGNPPVLPQESAGGSPDPRPENAAQGAGRTKARYREQYRSR